MQLSGWGCGGARKIIRLLELPLPAADAQTLDQARRVEIMDISVDDTFGTFYVTNNDKTKIKGYYSTLDALRPLFQLPEWQSVITGYYLNVTGAFNVVRISYFCPVGGDPRDLVRSFLAEHDLSCFTTLEAPLATKVAANYGGEELRFRCYLATYTHIGLDIMRASLHNSQCLFATFRWQVFMAGWDYRQHFAPTFEKLSPFYCGMSDKDRQQFWSDLSYWPNPPQVDWAHIFVNMVLACDWNELFGLEYPRETITIPQINQLLKRDHVFQIPLEWNTERV